MNKARLFHAALLIVVLWVTATNAIYAICHPEKTRTQLFLRLHRTAVLDWSD